MKLNVQQRDGFTVVEVLISRLDASMAGGFKNELIEITKEGSVKLVLDFSSVGFIDSSGLGALVSILKSMNGSGSIAIAGANSTVIGLFKLTRMDRVFSIYQNVDAALTA